jgi:hypothetical protein
MLSRRTLFIVLLVGLVAGASLVLNSFADDEPGLKVTESSGPDSPAGTTTEGTAASTNEADSRLEPASPELQQEFLELQRQIAATLTAQQLTEQIAAAKTHLMHRQAAIALDRARIQLEDIQDKFPGSEAAERATAAINAIDNLRIVSKPSRSMSSDPAEIDPNASNETKLTELTNERIRLLKRVNAENPLVKRLDAQIAALRESLAQESAQSSSPAESPPKN